jgi:hypothetical protein
VVLRPPGTPIAEPVDSDLVDQRPKDRVCGAQLLDRVAQG